MQIHGKNAIWPPNFSANLWNTPAPLQIFLLKSKHENLLTVKQRYETGPWCEQPLKTQFNTALLIPFSKPRRWY